MAQSDYVIKLRAEDRLSKVVEGVTSALRDTGAAASRLEDIKTRFKEIATGTAPLKRQLREIQMLMSEMNIRGLDATPEFTAMAQYAGQLRDSISDASAAVNRFANDTFKLQAAAEGIGAVAAAGSVAAGAMGMLGTENEKVTRAILKVQSALAMLNGVQAIANALNKDSALMHRIKQIRLAATTAAKTADTAATAANSVAEGANAAATGLAAAAKQKLNVAMAVGKALLGDWTGLVIVGAAALTTYALAAGDAADKTEEQTKALSRAAREQKEYTDKLTASAGDAVGRFMALQAAWGSLRTEAEKTRWLKDSQSDFSALGLSVGDLKTAEDLFANNTEKVVRSLEARAKAAAAMDMITKAYKDYYARLEANNSVAGGGYYERYHYSGPRKWRQYNSPAALKGLREGEDYTVQDMGYTKTFTLLDQGVRKLEEIENAARNTAAYQMRQRNDAEARADLQESVGKWSAEYKDAIAEVGKAGAEAFFTAVEPEKVKEVMAKEVKEAAEEGSIRYYQDLVAANNRILQEKAGLTQEEIDGINEQNRRYQEQIRLLQIAAGLVKEAVKPVTATIGGAALPEGAVRGGIEDRRASYRAALAQANQVIADAGLFIDGEEAQHEIDRINAQLATLNIPPLKLHVEDDGTLSLAAEQIDTMSEKEDKMAEALGGIGTAFTGIGSAMKDLAGDNEALSKGALIASAIGELALSFAKAMGQTKFGPWEWIAAGIGGVSVLTGLVASLQRFDSGGIVGGSSYSGDRTLIRANAGEMVLNHSQQARLYNAIRSGDLGSGSRMLVGAVDFRIKSGDLVATMSNHNTRILRQS